MYRVNGNRRSRRGVATGELAVCIPAIIALVMGTLECTTMIFVQQSLQVVAYETARIAIRPEGKNADVVSRANQVIAERRLVDASVSLSPSDIESLAPGAPITVTVRAPANRNSAMNLRFFTNSLQTTATMNKE